jgi:ribitol-5-phosphate 2-dehydrogenase
MINRIYRLVDIKRIEMIQRETNFAHNTVITKPDFISVCKADQRYYQGKRCREILNAKLPMALIHEATATVLKAPNDELHPGSKVVLIPLIQSNKTTTKANYDPDNRFMSSGCDGFLRDYVSAPLDRVTPIQGDYTVVYVFGEIISVVFNALEAFEKTCVTDKDAFGVWGDGSMGFITGLVLRCVYPQSKICVFGKIARRLQRFSFADELFYIDSIPHGLKINHAFECVGGRNSEAAMRQITQLISPQGCVNLLGVTEDEISINTRIVIDKGLRLIGNSRSDVCDFAKAVELIGNSITCRKHLETLISDIIEIRNESDIVKLFEQDLLNDFKTVGKWNM